jgi:hypothetical protein
MKSSTITATTTSIVSQFSGRRICQ